MNNVEEIYPISNESGKLTYYIDIINRILDKKHMKGNKVRIPQNIDRDGLLNKYKELPYEGMKIECVISQLTEDFFQGTSNWGNLLWSYNVGTAPSVNAIAMYTAALIENIYLINDDLAGNCCHIEQIISNLFKQLVKKENLKGLFTFGGTGTNLYGIKLGLDKTSLESIKCGMKKDVKIMITEDAHYAHITCADWLGVGIDNVVKMKSKGLYTDVEAAREQMCSLIKKGKMIAVIIINGGTTYNIAIDDIKAFRDMINEVVEEFQLDYTPHLHVDAVIGWSWLFYNDYNFELNELNIENNVLEVIRFQTRKMSEIKYADSWGVDFHKGVGGCPIPTSMFLVNNELELNYLTKNRYNGLKMHQIVAELSKSNPSDYTLETSRSAGPALAALSNLLVLGRKGYQKLLQNLIECTLAFRKELSCSRYIFVSNSESMGYCTMARIYENISDMKKEEVALRNSEFSDRNKEIIRKTNELTKSFYVWDKENRMIKEREFEYSYSSGFKKIDDGLSIEALKFYMVSPHMNVNQAKEMAHVLMSQVEKFMVQQR